MYGSYGSYSSLSYTLSTPIDISSRNMRADNEQCAFPSWPQRLSLSDSGTEDRPSSYLSDDDLFLSDPIEDDARSVSSASTSSTASPVSRSPQISEEQLLERERERHAAQRDFVRFLVAEKERRRQANASKRPRRGSNGSRKSPKNKLTSMTPIAEAAE